MVEVGHITIVTGDVRDVGREIVRTGTDIAGIGRESLSYQVDSGMFGMVFGDAIAPVVNLLLGALSSGIEYTGELVERFGDNVQSAADSIEFGDIDIAGTLGIFK